MRSLYKEAADEKIKLVFYPYTYVRVMAMKGKLYRRQEYAKLLKLGLTEIAKFMEETEYKKEINEVVQQFSEIGFDLLELALNRNLVRCLQKLRNISQNELQTLIDVYLLRYDYYNLKTIVRGKFSHLPAQEIEKLLIHAGSISREELQELMQKEDVEKVLEALPLVKKQKLQKAMHYFKENNSLFLVEQLLDHSYFDFVFTFSQRIPEQGKLFKDFLQYEIDILNLKTLLRLKKVNISEQKIKEQLLHGGKILSQAKLERLIQKDYTAILGDLEHTPFKDVMKKHRELIEQGDLTRLELALDQYLLKKATLLLHQHPLTIDTILGYLFAKDLEIKNLRTIIKAKQLHVSEQFIEQQLVIA